MHPSRREMIHTLGLSAAAVVLSPLARGAEQAEKAAGFTLPPLPYSFDALEPTIDAETMKIHHDLHHKAYVDNLNKALAGNGELLSMSITDLLRNISKVPEKSRQAVINNGGGHANHTMFWEIMGPKGGGQPKGELAAAIKTAFGSFEKFQELLNQAATTRFGSGWGWLILEGGQLKVLSTANQDSPLMTKGQTPILGIDVWEHAYYLKYRNRRPEYVKAWWNVVNWDKVTERYNQARKEG